MSDEKPNASPVAGVLVGHGVFLAACGLFGASSNGWAPSAMHSAYAGIGSCVVLTGCGILSLGSRKMYMIGVHIGLLLQLLFAGVFSVQAYKSYGKADNRFPLFITMATGTVAALGLMRALKPKKPKGN